MRKFTAFATATGVIFINNVINISFRLYLSLIFLSIELPRGAALLNYVTIIPMQDEMTTLPMPLLQSGCKQLGFSLSPAQIEQFQRYYELLIEWNEKFNLTSITSYEDVQTKHFLDSLSGWSVLVEELRLTAGKPLRLADVGTGAGFPGVPLKILNPALKLTLVDGTGKKIEFLRHVIQTLGLSDVTFVQGRAEELGREANYRAYYDVVTARAVAPLNTLVEYLLPWVNMQGVALIYKGASAAEEFIAARKAIELLGGETVRFAPVQVPHLEEKRFVLLIKKVRATPNLYPRSQGLARKKPL